MLYPANSQNIDITEFTRQLSQNALFLPIYLSYGHPTLDSLFGDLPDKALKCAAKKISKRQLEPGQQLLDSPGGVGWRTEVR